MANGRLNLGKQSGGVLSISFPDGVNNTEVVLPESGTLVNKDYADLKVALTDFAGANQSLTSSGYQKLPGGLIIQWGVTAAASSGSITFPISFPNSCFNVLMLLKGSENTVIYVTGTTTSGFTWGANAYAGTGYNAKAWFSIGY